MKRIGSAVWNGGIKTGDGKVSTESGVLDGVPYSFAKRFGDAKGSNPEELIGAAHAGCFSMAFAAGLAKSGYAPKRVSTEARVHLTKTEAGFSITKVDLVTEAEVPGIDAAVFQEHAQGAKKNCPVSRALAAIEITVDAKLV